MSADIRQRAEGHYLARGYNANVRVTRSRRPAEPVVDFTISVEKGPLYRLVDLSIDGGERTNDGLITRQVSDIEVGEPADLIAEALRLWQEQGPRKRPTRTKDQK